MKRVITSLFAALVAAVSLSAFGQAAAPSEDAAQAFVQKWADKDKFNVTWRLAGFSSQSFTAYPKKGEFNFHSSDYCERGINKAEFFAKDGKFVVRILRKNNGCTPAIMIFDPATGQGQAAEEVAGQYNILPGRILQLAE
jgi:hypothetical protein